MSGREIKKEAVLCYVSEELYEIVALAESEPFAKAYLWGAQCNGKRITPRTETGYLAMKDRRRVSDALDREGYTLIRPLPFHKQPEETRISADKFLRPEDLMDERA